MTTKTPHPAAHLLRAIADDKNVLLQEVEKLSDPQKWMPVLSPRVLASIANGYRADYFRIKPPTMKLNGMEFPEPMRDAPINGSPYYFIGIADGGNHFRHMEGP